MKNGTAPGHKYSLSARQQQNIVRLNNEGNLSLQQLAEKYGVSHMTIYRVLNRNPDKAMKRMDGDGQAPNQQKVASQDQHPKTYSSYG